jgi:acetoin utilization protein AcuB
MGTIVGALSVVMWGLSGDRSNGLTMCSSTIEHSLCPETKKMVAKPIGHKLQSITNVGLNLSKDQLYLCFGVSSILMVSAIGIAQYRRRKQKPADVVSETVESVKKTLEPKLVPGCVFTKRQQTMAILLNRLGDEAFEEMKIGHLLTKNVKSLPPNAPLEEVRRWFFTHHFRHVLVVEPNGGLKGIISARDLQRAEHGTASDIMTTNLVTVSPQQLIGPTITMMMERRISCLPVVEEGQLVGIVTTTDLLIALQCTFQILQSLGSLTKSGRRQPQSIRSGFGELNKPDIHAAIH